MNIETLKTAFEQAVIPYSSLDGRVREAFKLYGDIFRFIQMAKKDNNIITPESVATVLNGIEDHKMRKAVEAGASFIRNYTPTHPFLHIL